MELRTSKYGAESMSSSRNSSYSVSYNGRSPSDSEPAHWQAGCRLFKLLLLVADLPRFRFATLISRRPGPRALV